jgi:hypothetical protein
MMPFVLIVGAVATLVSFMEGRSRWVMGRTALGTELELLGEAA